jgi:hypothetical protein
LWFFGTFGRCSLLAIYYEDFIVLEHPEFFFASQDVSTLFQNAFIRSTVIYVNVGTFDTVCRLDPRLVSWFFFGIVNQISAGSAHF